MCSPGWGNLVAFDWTGLPVGREFNCKFLKNVKSPPHPPPPRRLYNDRCIILGRPKFQTGSPKGRLKPHDSQGNFQWTNDKIPCSFCTFETTAENVWSSAWTGHDRRTEQVPIRPGSHMPPMYVRCNRCYHLGHFSDEWKHAPLATRAIAELYHRHACEVELESTSQACRGQRLGWEMLPVTSVLISEKYPRQYQRPCRRCIGGIWEPGLTGTI